ncbi:hypothetical protein [Streptomyces radiopugnans]|uniref:Uncharacterized protein n=1 Tax=Streptomyces radiopugnans TaxID=403935 RepID=A0A1H9KAG0_9ACTN|nr:hypothetical protein [Streptomyces radiopugnans]SEQ96206.1 hypothetical protein SAMN05216481_12220 [Streptomyces radiopugnans]
MIGDQQLDASPPTVHELATAEAAFPKMVEKIGKLDLAEIQYKVDGCAGDPGADGSACYDNAMTVAVAPSVLELLLITDQPEAAID